MLPRCVIKDAGELYCYSVRVRSVNGHQNVMVGWAPRTLSLDSPQYRHVGFYMNAASGDEKCQPGATVVPRSIGTYVFKLPQDAIIVCEYDRVRGTIAFGWAGGAVIQTYTSVPKEPQLLPAFLLGNVGDSIELV